VKLTVPVVPPPKAKAFPVSPHPAKYIRTLFNPAVVAHAFDDHFSILPTGTVAPVAPPNCNASLVVPHPATPNFA